MKKVKTINIVGQNIKVRWTKEVFQDQYGNNLCGFYEPATQTIVVQVGSNKREEQVIFLHEICHAIMHTVGLAQVIDLKLQEIIAESFAVVMYDLMKK